MALINIKNLTFSYEGSYDVIFDDVSFQIDTDWKLGFTGRNGRGKTTFLNLLMGKYEYSGTISTPVAFDYFPFDVKDPSQSTMDVVSGITWDFEFWQLQRELTLLDVKEDVLCRPFCSLSKGEQTKVLLAGLFLKENNFLLIDEPTNHLDYEARQIVGDYLRTKKGFILVSHDRQFLDCCIDHILSVNKTNIEIQQGNFSSWWENKQRQDGYERAENDKLQKDIKKMTAAARRAAVWSDKVEKSKGQPIASGLKPDRGHIGHMAAKMMKRSKSLETRRQRAVEEKVKLLNNMETTDRLSIRPVDFHTQRLVELKDIFIQYHNQAVCGPLCFEVKRGDRIALQGGNGSGKSSVLKLIMGEEVPYEGMIKRGSNLVISYISQDTSFLKGNLRGFAAKSDLDESLLKAILRKMDFSREQFDKDMMDFSEGQKKKVLLAKSLCEEAHLYLWDEPLNFIDVLSRIQIENLIREYTPTMLFVEHDRAFVNEVATTTVTL